MKTTHFADVTAGSDSGGGGGGGGAAGGDLGGTYPGPTVTGINGVPVCATAPTSGQVLTFDGTDWCPAAVPPTTPTGPASGDLGGGYPSPQVTGLDGKPFAAPGSEANGNVIAYNSATGQWEFVAPAAGGLTSVTDGTTTVSPATSMTVPPHSLTDLGGGDASLGYVANVYGGEEILNTVAASGAAQTLPATANVHDITLTANCTLALPTLTSGKACSIAVVLRQDGTGSRTVTWPGSVAWVTGAAPTLKTAPASVDVISLFTLDGGTTWGGSSVGAGTLAGLSDVSLAGLADADRLRYSTSDSKWHNSALIWRPLTTYDGTNWLPLVDGDGNCIMAEA